MGNNKGLGSGTCEWPTPMDFFKELDAEFHFTLDPCSNEWNHKCDKYYTVKEDGLAQDWSGECVYMNPPYGRGVLEKWVKKASEEGSKENTTVVALIPASTDTRWFHTYVYGKAKVRFVKGRLKFGDAKKPAPFGSMVVVWQGPYQTCNSEDGEHDDITLETEETTAESAEHKTKMIKEPTYNTGLDWTGTPWYKKQFQFPERTIRIATSFSGIGAAEYALKRLGLKHKVIFACDNGERYLKFGYQKLAELAKGLDEDEKTEFVDQLLMVNKPKNNSLTFDSIYSNLFEKCLDTKEKIELPKECIDILTKGLTKSEVIKYVNSLYKQTGKTNNVKKSYMANYDLDEKDWHNDIRFLDGEQYKDQIDIYVGGSPCQSYSIQNYNRLGLEDTRGTLFCDFARVIDECRPKVFIYENVKGMTNHDNGKSWKVIKREFESLGYDIHFRILNAVDYGSTQCRERLFCIGFLNTTDFKFPRPIKPQHCIMDILDDLTPGVRQMTVPEMLKYMGFDSDFKQVVADTTLSHQLGNSIVVEVFMALFQQIDITQYGVET